MSRKTRIVAKQLELPFTDTRVEHVEEAKVATHSKIISFCTYVSEQSKSEQKAKKEKTLKELADEAYELCF
ncbi:MULTISPECIES: hypothetical protein [unclassified Pseudodesulfovibrio]|uniref:hypothetical protein n=1 Tax=unclassified Pseudodesulfovibrio TaxID=2661612 RepID=UPI000FEB8A97|nr:MULTISPECIES: hypothetical protein [unclassified Pseudodesulfovibrio]MCJ2165595.1 hypothetical protein [Pseudodesulfovibrio sp. S3-i]RWU03003.1 hypothetical protein DWB63_13210 [Pseudodesulfovibrio sp. S3]